MTRSLRKQLCWWHTALFAAAIAISLILAWRAIPDENETEPVRTAATWRYFGHTALESCIPFVVLGAISWWIIHRSLAPVVDLTNAAEHIHEGSLHQRLPLRGTGDELDRLTSVLNDMTGRLETSFQRIREFTLHASHELKTPLTILRSGFEQTLARPGLNEQLKDQIINWMDETERLNRIVSGLTLLTRADAREFALTKETVALHDLVRDAASEAEILGQTTNLHVTSDLCGPVFLSADRHRIRQLLLNLTDNAVKYNRQDGYVRYGLSTAGNAAIVTVESGGRGILPEDLPQIFDRFFRSIDSRGSGQEGVGLGLSISQLIAGAHGGEITAASVPDRTTIRVEIPMESMKPEAPPAAV